MPVKKHLLTALHIFISSVLPVTSILKWVSNKEREHKKIFNDDVKNKYAQKSFPVSQLEFYKSYRIDRSFERWPNPLRTSHPSRSPKLVISFSFPKDRSSITPYK
ncbi:hypothetical protein EUGRSUZ_B03638 [Eucalyptus grandis]|uniref:Uncharacterized protein n=2 Tax=Eucalyptus grandis TaxID=71139 RepID=A0ACC3LX60_EUCGR|nr:hypothetical protein EUGRSUZ_B03638 [Eucalyptus grandis]